METNEAARLRQCIVRQFLLLCLIGMATELLVSVPIPSLKTGEPEFTHFASKQHVETRACARQPSVQP